MKKDNSTQLEMLLEKAVRLDVGKFYEIEEHTICNINGSVSKCVYSYSCDDEVDDPSFPRSIDVNQGIITFSMNRSSKYFIPYTPEIYRFLRKEIGLKYVESSVFSSPLNFRHYPQDKKLKAKWFKLLKENWDLNQSEISKISQNEISKKCNKTSIKLGIRKLDKKFLDSCQEIPFGGLKKNGKRFYPWLYVYSISDVIDQKLCYYGSHLDIDDLSFFIGGYDYDENFIIFTANTGKTYIAQMTDKTKKILDQANYRRIFMPIPLNRTDEWYNAYNAFTNLDWLLGNYGNCY